jgi:hypothetical protein
LGQGHQEIAVTDFSQDTEEQRQEQKVAEAIRHYLVEHPQAMDTLEGIAEWWLLRQEIRVAVQRVERALGQLTAQGYLETLGTGANRRFRLRQEAND